MLRFLPLMAMVCSDMLLSRHIARKRRPCDCGAVRCDAVDEEGKEIVHSIPEHHACLKLSEDGRSDELDADELGVFEGRGAGGNKSRSQ